MDKATRARLEAAGFRVGHAEDFLGLTEEERRLVDLRISVSRVIRRRREEGGVTQKQLAAKLKSSQSRVAKIEAGAADVSLDLLFKAFFATGGSLDDLTARLRKRKRATRGTRADASRADGS
jgi:hypothetical protein